MMKKDTNMTPGKLVGAVADAFDVSESEVTQYDRRLLEAGLRTKGGRGPSAPDVTPDDAARLIIAVLLRMPLAQTADTVKGWWHLPMVRDVQDETAVPSGIRKAADDWTEFGPALTAIIADCVSGEMESLLGAEKLWGEKFRLELKLQDEMAEIQIGLFLLSFGVGLDTHEERSDVLTTQLVGIRPILTVAREMRGVA
jgi:hypothetical protein